MGGEEASPAPDRSLHEEPLEVGFCQGWKCRRGAGELGLRGGVECAPQGGKNVLKKERSTGPRYGTLWRRMTEQKG